MEQLSIVEKCAATGNIFDTFAQHVVISKMGRGWTLVPQLRRSHGVRETAEKVGFADALGGAAVHRCDNRLVSHPASAAEVTKIARERLFPQPRQSRAPKC